ncbi:MAG: ATP-binding cassette domain-containing protein [Ginsengibacter sp.]
MKISLQNLGKRFNREWVFRNLNYQFTSGRSYAITGPNGSGKSTLLQLISGASMVSEGTVVYENIKPEHIYKYVSLAAPYLQLVEEMTLHEFLKFHFGLKNRLPTVTTTQIISTIELKKAAHKQIRYFSSGMKQRVNLAQAIFSNVPVVLLDEPTTNFDEEGILLYKDLVNNFCKSRLLVVSSNDKQEYDFCDEILDMKNYKKDLG